MTTGEQLHRMAENVYKHTIDGFNPEVRNLVTLGRAYEKALQSVSQAAKDYFNAIVTVGELASETKDSRQLGQSLLQIAETYRQIETEREITVHALRKELLHPLEGKLEQEWKNILQVQKTYSSENKAKSEAVDKCRAEVKKLQKKTQKNHTEKYLEKEQRMSEELQLLTKQLHNFRSNGLKEAWSEERRRYCYLVERYCSLIKNDAAFFSKAQSVLHHRLPKWAETCEKPERLPEECEDILSFDFSGPLETPLQLELRNSRRLYERNVLLAQNEEKIKKSPQRETPSPKHGPEGDRPQLSVEVEPQQPPPPSSTGVTSSYSATLPSIKKFGGSGGSSHPSVHQLPGFQQAGGPTQAGPQAHGSSPGPHQLHGSSMAQHPPQQQPPPVSSMAGRHSKSIKSPHSLHAISQTMPRQTFIRRVSEGGDIVEADQKMTRVQALYNHGASGDTQLSFSEGDVIGLVGPKNNGWFYGHNFRTRKNGWFPITYTQPMADIMPRANGTSNSMVAGKPVAASMDNLQSVGGPGVGGDYPAPDYSGPGSPASPMAPAPSSLPQVGIAIPTTVSTINQTTLTVNQATPTSVAMGNGNGNGIVKPSHGLLMTAPLGQGEVEGVHPASSFHPTPTAMVHQHMATAQIQQAEIQLTQIQVAMQDAESKTPSSNTNGNQADKDENDENSPFSKVTLRKTVTNDRSAPMIPRDYSLGEYARH